MCNNRHSTWQLARPKCAKKRHRDFLLSIGAALRMKALPDCMEQEVMMPRQSDASDSGVGYFE
jgi:hypothetical protein